MRPVPATPERRERPKKTEPESGRAFTSGALRFPNALPIVDEASRPIHEEYPDHNYTQQTQDLYKEQNDQEPDDSYDEAQSLLDLASAYMSMGDKQEAIETLKEAIAKGSGATKLNAQKALDDLL